MVRQKADANQTGQKTKELSETLLCKTVQPNEYTEAMKEGRSDKQADLARGMENPFFLFCSSAVDVTDAGERVSEKEPPECFLWYTWDSFLAVIDSPPKVAPFFSLFFLSLCFSSRCDS